jgi:dTDP-glucose pyrophosphorylase
MQGTRLAPIRLCRLGYTPLDDKPIPRLSSGNWHIIVSSIYTAVNIWVERLAVAEWLSRVHCVLREQEPLGTAGPLSLVEGPQETFLVMNGDLLTTLDYTDMLRCHRERGALATVACYQRDVKIDLGVLQVSAEGWVTDYIEKPTYHYSVSMGVYAFEPAIMDFITANQRLDLPDLVLRLLVVQQPVNAYPFGGYWLDIAGTTIMRWQSRNLPYTGRPSCQEAE